VPEVHIQIGLPTTFPSADDLAIRRRLEAALDNGVGRVTDTGAGGGVMDLWLRVDDPRAAYPWIRQLALELGIADRTKIAVRKPKVFVTVHWDDIDLGGASIMQTAEELAELAVEREVATVSSIVEMPGSIDIAFEAPNADVAATILAAMADNLGIAERTTIKTW
jgi:hypothetical protein